MIQEERGFTFTLATIRGSEEEVDRDLSKYFETYDPRGYNTKITKPVTKVRPGEWEVRVFRYSSCD
jgi:hypothetical protein